MLLATRIYGSSNVAQVVAATQLRIRDRQFPEGPSSLTVSPSKTRSAAQSRQDALGTRRAADRPRSHPPLGIVSLREDGAQGFVRFPIPAPTV